MFRALWIANLVSGIGTWVQEVGAGWLMTDLGATPQQIALLQAAASAPMVLLVLPAGVLADAVDRRRVLVISQLGMVLAAVLLAAATWTGTVTPALLLLLTAALGVGSALGNPAWQTLMTDLVPRDEIAPAVGLHGVSLSVSRALGPVVGGLAVAAAGPGAAFALNAASFAVLIVVLLTYAPARAVAPAPSRAGGWLAALWAYVKSDRAFRAVLVRTAIFVFFAAALWGLMPLVAREHLRLGPRGFGLLVGCLGAGAVAMAWVLPRAQRAFSPDALVAAAALAAAGAVAVTVWWPAPALACVMMAFYGAGWVTNVTLVNAGAQLLAPPALKARAFGCYLATHFGAMAAGSFAFGSLAERTSVTTALLVSAGGLALGTLTLPWWSLRGAAARGQ